MSEELIPIEYRPFKKIVVLEVIKLDAQDLFNRVAGLRMHQGGTMLSWVDGIAFLAFPADARLDEVKEQSTKGVAYFASVLYAPLPTYQPSIKVGAYQIPVLNQAQSPIFKSLANWLKNRDASKS
jgi:hypothetical protein